MMLAYKQSDLEALDDFNLAKTLKKDGMLADGADLAELEAESKLYHPGILMRILLFVVGLIGVNGAVGMFFFMFQDALDKAWQILFLVGGLGLLIAHEAFFVRSAKHYKTGLTEVFLFGGLIMLGIGINGDSDSHIWVTLLVMAAASAVAAIRYLNNVLVAAALALVVAALLNLADQSGPMLTNLLPFIVMLIFTGGYFLGQRLEKNANLKIWENQINTLQAVSLVLIYIGGNYFVVRQLGQSLKGTYLEPGQNIPFAWLFYVFTAGIPLFYLLRGIKTRNRIFIWIGLATAGFSVFTFKYYFSLGHPEITITLAGMLLLGIAVYFLHYLKKPKKGITRERVVAAKLDFLISEGMLISQTMGATAQPHNPNQNDLMGGGGFGGGGASGNF
jgi:hypothetical protein